MLSGNTGTPGIVYLIRDSPPSGTAQPAITNYSMRICQSNTLRFALNHPALAAAFSLQRTGPIYREAWSAVLP